MPEDVLSGVPVSESLRVVSEEALDSSTGPKITRRPTFAVERRMKLPRPELLTVRRAGWLGLWSRSQRCSNHFLPRGFGVGVGVGLTVGVGVGLPCGFGVGVGVGVVCLFGGLRSTPNAQHRTKNRRKLGKQEAATSETNFVLLATFGWKIDKKKHDTGGAQPGKKKRACCNFF